MGTIILDHDGRVDAVNPAAARLLGAGVSRGVDPASTPSPLADVLAAEAGWNAPPTADWLQQAADRASETHWGRPSSAMGEGGTIPFMGMLGERFPDAQFLITGVLGPGSNAHGPNEFLHLPMARNIAATVSEVLDAHARR